MRILLFLLFAIRCSAALSGSTVWEVRGTGNDNNGGGFKTGASGTDWSQQTSPQYALTSIATAGTGATFLTATAANDMVGNIVHVVSGTNFTAGFYEIISVSVGVSVTCDANVCTGVGASGVLNIGGALATIGKIGSASANQGAVAGNTIWVKGTISQTTTTDTVACSGSTTSPIQISGYGTTRADGYLGRTSGNGAIITTNMPSLSYTTGAFSLTGSNLIVATLNISSTRNGNAISPNAAGIVFRACKMLNNTSGASGVTLSAGSSLVNGTIIDCDISLTNGGNAGTAAVSMAAVASRLIGCRITSSAVGVTASGVGSVFIGNTIYRCTTGIAVTVTTAYSVMHGNTIVLNSGDGIDIVTATSVPDQITCNMITDNGGFGIDLNSAAVPVVLAYNRYRDNTSGNINSGTDWVAATTYGAVTSGSGTSDYTNAAGNDYSLLSTSPGVSVALPLYASMGALQRSQTGGGGATMFSYTYGGSN